MAENLTDTNVGNTEYIRKADVLNLPQNIERNLCGEIVERSIDVKAIESIESADVAPVVHGKWIDEDPAFAEYFANCSVCGYEIDVHNERGYFNFCPNCGAKMDGENKDE